MGDNPHEKSRVKHLGRRTNDEVGVGKLRCVEVTREELRSAIVDCVELTKNNTGITLSVAFDYGGRAEILEAVKHMLADKIEPGDISEEFFARYLYTAELPDPDLIIRTAGEMRLSNFLLWQLAYSEYYVTSVYWPDFDENEAVKAVEAYGQRKRKFGRIPPIE